MTDWKQVVIDKIRQQILDEHPTTNNFALPDNLSRKLKTYMSLREDLILCIKIATELKNLVEKGPKDDTQHILTALWSSMIIIYGKCFTDASKAKKSKLEIKHILTQGQSSLLDIHEKIMDTRHSYIAHRGDNENDQSIVFFKQPKIRTENPYTEYQIKSLRANNFGIENLERSLELLNTVYSHVDQKLRKDWEKVHNDVMTKYSPDELAAWLIK